MSDTKLKVGFIGLGVMGAPMSTHLIGKVQLFVHSAGKIPVFLAEQGATICTNARGVAERADIIFVMVPDTPDVEKVLFHPNGVAEGLSKGKVLVDCSSIDPIATREFAKRIAKLGCDYVDAPVSGGEVGAKAATLSIMVGGTEDAFARVAPLLKLMGKNVTRVGDVGDGQVCKVANQIIVALNIGAVAEALVYATKAGADPGRVREALMGGFASSRVLEVHGDRMIKRNFEPGFRISLHQKDLNLALQGARALGLALPQTATAAQLMHSCAALGHGQADHSALVKAIENMAQTEVAAS